MISVIWFRVDVPNLALRPFERYGLWVVRGDESIDRFPNFLRGSEAGATQHPPGQDAEPALDLVEPTGMRGREVKVHVRVPRPPAVVLRFVNI